jgi:hypothetical protein
MPGRKEKDGGAKGKDGGQGVSLQLTMHKFEVQNSTQKINT